VKILYFSDNREDYTSGNYYVDILKAFEVINPKDFTVFGPGYAIKIDELPEPSEVDLVVYGHSFIDIYIPKGLKKRKQDELNGLNLEKYKDVPSIMFSKNEYELDKMNMRIAFIKSLRKCTLVVNTKKTLNRFKSEYRDIIWMPFGINSNIFYDKGFAREVDIGMRGNAHLDYIGNLRLNIQKKLKSKLKNLDLDVKISSNHEDFLYGEDYINWINNNKFTVNTVSALKGVNTKFAEIIACGSILLAPRFENYEGLLKKNRHYIPIDKIYKYNDRESIKSFYLTSKASMQKDINKYLKAFSYDNMIPIIIDKSLGKISNNTVISIIKEQYL